MIVHENNFIITVYNRGNPVHEISPGSMEGTGRGTVEPGNTVVSASIVQPCPIQPVNSYAFPVIDF